MKKIVWLLALLLCNVSFSNGDVGAGERKAQTCAACHGEKGISQNPSWPSLAGQHAGYLLKQLNDYKEGGARPNAAMGAIVASLSQKDMQDLAAFYASLTVAQGSTPKSYLTRGERLYRGGDFKKGIAACIACHGPQGKGNAEANFPLLSAQHAPYSIEQLVNFKKDKRRNDINAIMRDISKRMSKEDMTAVSYYIQGLH